MSVIWWIRRDLRLQDNQALSAALRTSEQVIPLFILDPRLTETQPTPEKRLNFLWGGLHRLDESLRVRGGRLILRRGHPLEEITKLFHETTITTIFAEADYTPFARQRDQEIARQFPLQLVEGLTIRSPGSVIKADGQPYIVYTPFSKAWKSIPIPHAGVILPAPDKILTPEGLPGLPIPETSETIATRLFAPGEAEAQRRLSSFTSGEKAAISHYAANRNRPDLEGTSGLSPYLRFGMLSARQAAITAEQARHQASDEETRKGAQTWLDEIIWREFYFSILFHFPIVLQESFRSELRNIPWQNNPADFEAWKTGQTGYPIVDAAMRQLLQTGWMHNRARMIAASFLVKDLLIDWRWGERWFRQHLIDGDPASNNGGWQWTAGTGTDAAPYFRIFNPILQGQKYDPQGAYLKRWIPELAEIPQKFLQTPWEMPLQLQSQIGFRLGIGYPAPIVDHTLARVRALETYRLAKNS